MEIYYKAIFWLLGLVYLGFAVLEFLARRGMDTETHDERQRQHRGRGYQLAFLTLIPAVLICEGLELFGIVWCAQGLDMVLCVLLALLVFGVYCAYTGSYFAFMESRPVGRIVSHAFLAACFMLPEVDNLLDGTTSFSELFHRGQVYFFVGLALLVFTLNLGIKLVIDRRREKE